MLIIIAQVTDPIRIALVALCLWLIAKTVDPGWGRFVPTAIAVSAVSVVASLMIWGMAAEPRSMNDFTLIVLIGCVSNAIIAVVVLGVAKLVQIFRKA